jgi:hypothetical protein
MADILRFTPEVPVEVALKYPTGKPVQGHDGTDMMFTLVDGRLMFLAPPIAAQIDAMQIRAGEPFWITRNAGKSGVKGSVSWDIRRPNAGSPVIQAPPARPEVPTNGNPHPVTSGNGFNSDVRTQAESAVMTAIEACWKGEKYAASIGFACHFEHEDVRALANTILIGAQQNGGKR